MKFSALLARAKAFLRTRNGKIAAGGAGAAGVVGLALWQRSKGTDAPEGIPVQGSDAQGLTTNYLDPAAGDMPTDWWGPVIPDDYYGGLPSPAGGGGGSTGGGGGSSTPGVPSAPSYPSYPGAPTVGARSSGGGVNVASLPTMPQPDAVPVPRPDKPAPTTIPPSTIATKEAAKSAISAAQVAASTVSTTTSGVLKPVTAGAKAVQKAGQTAGGLIWGSPEWVAAVNYAAGLERAAAQARSSSVRSAGTSAVKAAQKAATKASKKARVPSNVR